MAKLFRSWLIVLVIGVFNFQGVFAYSSPNFELFSETIIIYNQSLETLVYAKNATKKFAPASLTKMLTALVILDEEELTKEVKVATKMLTGLQGASLMGAKVNEVFTIEQLLYGLMLPSGCDAAQILAIDNAGTEALFASKLNTLAASFGLKDSNFVNASGLDGKNQYTTAIDMLEILKRAKAHPILNTIMSTTSYNIISNSKHLDGLTLKSTLTMKKSSNSNYSPFIIGGKTGYTDDAGTCLASFGLIAEDEYLVVSMRAPKIGNSSKSFVDTKNSYKWLDENFFSETVLKENQLITTIDLLEGKEKIIEIIAPKELKLLLEKPDTMDNVVIEFEEISNKAPIKKGDRIAVAIVTYQGVERDRFEVVASKAYKQAFYYQFRDFVMAYWLWIIATLSFIILSLLTVLIISLYNGKKLANE